jgi:hypothetical protein
MRINKDGTANWSLGSIVEVTTHTGNHDPNHYFARCLTGGACPTVRVLHEKYPEPLTVTPQNTPVSLWRELSEEEVQRFLGEEEYVVNQEEEPEEIAEVVEEPSERLCSECGKPLTKSSPGCSMLHFGTDRPFTAF